MSINAPGEYFGHPFTTDAKIESRKRLIDFAKNEKKRENSKELNKVSEKINAVDNRPDWFKEYISKISTDGKDVLEEIKKLASMKLEQISKHIGGDFRLLPYEIMDTLLVDGSDHGEVAEILKQKRSEYVKIHPEETRGVPGAGEGIIRFNGQFVDKKKWNTASDSEKRSALVGTTCFHYNSGTPGMDDSPDDRF